jgi:hypothetical protein
MTNSRGGGRAGLGGEINPGAAAVCRSMGIESDEVFRPAIGRAEVGGKGALLRVGESERVATGGAAGQAFGRNIRCGAEELLGSVGGAVVVRIVSEAGLSA